MKYICINPIYSNRSIEVGTIYNVENNDEIYYHVSSIDKEFNGEMYYGIQLISINLDLLKKCFVPLREFNLDKIL